MKYKVGDRVCSKFHKSSNDIEIIEVLTMIDGKCCYRVKNHETNQKYLIWEYDMSNYKLVEEETKPEFDYVAAMDDLMGLDIERSCINDDYNEYKKAVEEHGFFSEEALTRKYFIHLRKIGTAQNVLENFGFNLPDGYVFKDENGNVINAQKIVLEKKTVEEKYSDVKIQIFGNVVILKGGINADNPTEYMNEVVHYIVKLLGNPKHNQFIEEFLDNPWVRILVFDFNSIEFNNSFDDIVTNFKQ
jgi:hypothetical protein